MPGDGVASVEATTHATAPAAEGELKPTLGLTSATTLIVGSAIGSGIFVLPALMAAQVQAPGLLLLVWVAGGVLSLFGALTFAEMGAMYPRAGGQYVFLREAFGRPTAFLFGWMSLAINYTGTIAAVAWVFAIFLGTLFPFTLFQTQLVAVACIWFLTLVNWAGVRHGGLVQNLSTFAKVAAILALVALGFLLGSGTGQITTPVLPSGVAGGAIVAAFGLALVSALFAFDGWSSVTFVASEIKNPQKIIPRAAILGVLIVTAVYLLANAVYLHVVPLQEMIGSTTVAFDVASRLLGSQGAQLLAIAVVISTFGTVNAFVLAGPRIYYALAKDGLFYRGFGSVHPKRATPDFGLILQAEIASLLVLTGTYAQLVTWVVLALWTFYGFAGVALFVLRRKAKDVPRPYRTWGYPVVPVVFVAAAIFIVVNSLLFDTENALFGLGLVLLGVPVYGLLRLRERRGATAP